MPDLYWTKLTYKDGLYPKFEEKPSKGQNKILTMFYMILLAYCTVLKNQELAEISWNLVKMAIFKEILGVVSLEIVENVILICVRISIIFQY